MEPTFCWASDAPGEPMSDVHRMFQRMPELRVRVNPVCVPELCAWLYAASAEWRAVLRRTHRGMTPGQRAALRGSKAFARHALATISRLVDLINQSVSLADYNDTLTVMRSIAPIGDTVAQVLVSIASPK